MNQNNTMGKVYQRRFGFLVASVALFAAPALWAQSNTNHASDNGQEHASTTATTNANVNGVGSATAPVPETSTWVAMATLVGAAALMRRRSRKTA